MCVAIGIETDIQEKYWVAGMLMPSPRVNFFYSGDTIFQINWLAPGLTQSIPER
jgi:hypothetical protein